MKDQSIFNLSSDAVNQDGINEYANELIMEVCLEDDTLSKYQKIIEKRYGVEYFKKCNNFVKEVQRSIGNKKFSNSAVINLKYLANEINISSETVDLIANHFNQLFEQERISQEEAKRLKSEVDRKKKDEDERRRREEEEREREEKKRADEIINTITKRRRWSISVYALAAIICAICAFTYSYWNLIYVCLASLASLIAFFMSDSGVDKIFKTIKGINTLMIVTSIYVALALAFMSPWWLGLLVTIGGAGIVLLTIMILDGAFD